MDIYHIWTTYNKKWSKYEILAFSVILLLTVIIMVYCLWKKKLNIIQAVAMIKTSQLVFMRGLFEWDDMIHVVDLAHEISISYRDYRAFSGKQF